MSTREKRGKIIVQAYFTKCGSQTRYLLFFTDFSSFFLVLFAVVILLLCFIFHVHFLSETERVVLCEKESELLLWHFRWLILLSNEELKKNNANAKTKNQQRDLLRSFGLVLYTLHTCVRNNYFFYDYYLTSKELEKSETQWDVRVLLLCRFACLLPHTHTHSTEKKRNFNRCFTCSLNSAHRKIYITINKYNKMKRVIHRMKKHIANIPCKESVTLFPHAAAVAAAAFWVLQHSIFFSFFHPIVCSAHKKCLRFASHSLKLSIHKCFICYFIVSNHLCFVALHCSARFFLLSAMFV